MKADKHSIYKQANTEINSILEGESNMILKMATINCVLKKYLPYFYWVGFYCLNENELIVGPYQGTLGCLHIPLSKGVCGLAASTEKVQIVEDVHLFPDHIACDENTRSEIVLPVWNNQKKLIAVFDVDSTELAAFDGVDKQYLTELLELHFSKNNLVQNYQ
ncbi:MAG: GAF domain-containing protein [Saprospiraceae bacterium]|nr:GAF domain-containing protein [Saprospiraceae bacterium]